MAGPHSQEQYTINLLNDAQFERDTISLHHFRGIPRGDGDTIWRDMVARELELAAGVAPTGHQALAVVWSIMERERDTHPECSAPELRAYARATITAKLTAAKGRVAPTSSWTPINQGDPSILIGILCESTDPARPFFHRYYGPGVLPCRATVLARRVLLPATPPPTTVKVSWLVFAAVTVLIVAACAVGLTLAGELSLTSSAAAFAALAVIVNLATSILRECGRTARQNNNTRARNCTTCCFNV